MPKIDIAAIPVRTSCAYPSPYNEICRGREKQALGNAGGLDQFGVNLTRLKPGASSAHKHWHRNEDEMVFILVGEATLVEDSGETLLEAGDCATFKAGVENGHMLVNRSGADCVLLEIGTRAQEDLSSYTDPDVDMQAVKQNGSAWQILRKDGTPYA